MTDLKQYSKLGPFTADELVRMAQTLLDRRVSHPFTKRTLRFYIAQGAVPSPLGSPKFARYSHRHLVRVLATRMLQDQGYKLEEIVAQFEEGDKAGSERLEADVSAWLGEDRSAVTRIAPREQQTRTTAPRTAGSHVGEICRRIHLSDNVCLVIYGDHDVENALQKARTGLDKVVRTLK